MSKIREKIPIVINEQGQCNIPQDIETLMNYFAQRVKESSKNYNEGLLMTHHLTQRLICLCECEVMLKPYDKINEV